MAYVSLQHLERLNCIFTLNHIADGLPPVNCTLEDAVRSIVSRGTRFSSGYTSFRHKGNKTKKKAMALFSVDHIYLSGCR